MVQQTCNIVNLHDKPKKKKHKNKHRKLNYLKLLLVETVFTVCSLFSNTSLASSKLQLSSEHSLSMLPGRSSSRKPLSRGKRLRREFASLPSRNAERLKDICMFQLLGATCFSVCTVVYMQFTKFMPLPMDKACQIHKIKTVLCRSHKMCNYLQQKIYFLPLF